MGNFIARTRLRGTIEYRKATWLDGHFGSGRYGVRFKDDPERRVYPEEQCAIAADDKYLLGGKE